MTEQEKLQKSIDNVVEKILGTETQPTDQNVEKAMPSSLPANGGEDRIRSGSPLTEEQKLMEEKKKKEDEAKKAAEEAAASENTVAKAEDCDEDDKDDKDEMKKKHMKMKKSLEELSAHLDEEELELIKAWREESDKEETVAKSATVQEEPKQEPKQEDLAKSLAKVVEEQIAPLKKALDEKDTLIKNMSDKIEKMASQPAYDRRSISNLETLEKSGAEASQTISKSTVTEKLLQLQLAGKGVNSHHIAEFEATGNISDPAVKAMVFKELKLN